MNTSNYIAVIADDLTGANDTALQFFLRGCKTQVAFGEDISVDENLNTEVFALSTETRNVTPDISFERVKKVCETILKKYNFEYVYKKMDSVLRGNVAVEVSTILDSMEYDAAVIFPAFPSEGRTTVGGYHLLKGLPVQRSEFSRDPFSPVTESNIVNLLRNQLPEDKKQNVDIISLDIVMKGAGPILTKLNELISKGKKMIVADAVTTTDLEQIALAVSKSTYNILPCGSAGGAQALSKIWYSETEEKVIRNIEIPKLPKLMVSGSATEMTASQIRRLQDNDDFDNISFLPIRPENIFTNDFENIASKVISDLSRGCVVVLHSSQLTEDGEKLNSLLLEYELTKEMFISKICDYLAAISRSVLQQKQAVLITVGGETSYKCCRAIGCKSLEITDTVAPAIPLGIDNKGQYIVTKSGNLGSQNTLIDIVRYFEQDK